MPPQLPPGTLNDVVVTNPGGGAATKAKAWFADFADVPHTDFLQPAVEKMVRNAVTSGCGGGNYCPAYSLTRAEAAKFLLRAKHGALYLPAAGEGDHLSGRSQDRPVCRLDRAALVGGDLGRVRGRQVLRLRHLEPGDPRRPAAQVHPRRRLPAAGEPPGSLPTCPTRTSTRAGSSSLPARGSRRAAGPRASAPERSQLAGKWRFSWFGPSTCPSRPDPCRRAQKWHFLTTLGPPKPLLSAAKLG